MIENFYAFLDSLNESNFDGFDGLYYKWETSSEFNSEMSEKDLIQKIEKFTDEKVTDISIIDDKTIQVVLSNGQRAELEFLKIRNPNSKNTEFIELVNIGNY